MPSFKNGSLRLFRFAGIDVFLHWAWFLVAAFEISNRTRNYSSPVWNVLEYLTLFLIVMVHEFGHALACRQVGGIADRIMLWPLGGVAYVDPPPRPGATLWSIAAGPLVNVALIPILKLIGISSRSFGWAATMPDAYDFQSSPHLSARWRPDSAVVALVRTRTRAQPVGSHRPRICRSRRTDWRRIVVADALVRNTFGLYPDELLERAATGASTIETGQATPA